MATQYTSILKLALPTAGELDGTWGDVVNDNITSMIEEAIAGMTTINTWTTNAASIGSPSNGTTSPSRAAIIELTDTGVSLTAQGTLTIATVPASKIYVVRNATLQDIRVTRGGSNTVIVPKGNTQVLVCDGTDVFEMQLPNVAKIQGWATNTGVDYDLNGDGSLTTTDTTGFNFIASGLSYTGFSTETFYRGLEAAWAPISGAVLDDCKFRIFPIRGNSVDAQTKRIGGTPNGFGDVTWIGNVSLDGTSSRVTSGIVTGYNDVKVIANPDTGTHPFEFIGRFIAGTSLYPQADLGGALVSALIYAEDMYSLTGTAINSSNGGIQYKTITGNTTFTKTLLDGTSIILRLVDADLYTITWPTGLIWVGPNGNTAPTLTGSDMVMFFTVSTADYAVYLGSYE